MELNENARIDTSQVEDRRGSGGGLAGIPIPIGGGKGGLVGVVVALLVALIGGGFGLNAMTDDGGGGDDTALEQKCAADDALQQLDCRNTLYVNSIQAYWRTALPEVFGEQYRPSDTVFFRNSVVSGCGYVQSGVGPFYCPADHLVFIDLLFYRRLTDELGAGGEFVQPYVLAHEYGHHVQSLLGTEAQMRRQQQRDPDSSSALSVKLELQADCYAGVWAKNSIGTTDEQGQKIFKSITEEDIGQAIDAAERIGDDAIANRAGRPVNPQEFTHGTSEQRKQWFTKGYSTGDPKSCDTFGNGTAG